MSKTKYTYGTALREGFRHLLANHQDVYTIGQGLWSPWYVGSSMKDLDKEFGKDRVIDTPVSEAATTGLAAGSSLCGHRPIVIHPRMDFMVLAADPMVNQAAKWSHMLGGQAHPAVTIRGIINRGGQQGAQHSQALHSWYAHIPGLRVVMPATVADARDLLIASALCDDPVLLIDDRWLYEQEEELPASKDVDLSTIKPQVLRAGTDITLVGASHATLLNLQAAKDLEGYGINAEVIDLRVINPLEYTEVIESVTKTGRLLVVDGSWETCGLGGEIMAGVTERVPLNKFRANPARMSLPHAPAPTSGPLEDIYYIQPDDIVSRVQNMMKGNPVKKGFSSFELGL